MERFGETRKRSGGGDDGEEADVGKRRRNTGSETIQYLREKSEREREVKEREMELKREEMAIRREEVEVRRAEQGQMTEVVRTMKRWRLGGQSRVR